MKTTPVKIKSIRRLEVPDKVFDVTVDGNHNLFTTNVQPDSTAPFAEIGKCQNFVLAHNCTVPFGIHEQQIARAKAEDYKQFLPMVLGQQSNNSHVASVMEHKGTYLDQPYLKSQMKSDSDLHRILQEAKDQMKGTDAAHEANAILCEERGAVGSLFDEGGGQAVEIFNIDKQEHRQVLFADVLALEPVSGFGAKDRACGKKTMTLDKLWQSEHREVYEVSQFTRISKVSKLISSYIKSFHEKVTESDDGRVDGRLRPSYGFLYVKTGRGNSFKPSLQQTPTRSKEAKFVKRMFATKYGVLKLKTDFSANEVRFAANIAGDKVMAEPFNVARQLRRDMFLAAVDGITAEVDRLKGELKTRGDIHIQNVYRFFGKWIAKSDPLRDAIKGVVFGVIYGKSAATLGRDIWSQKVNEVKDKVYALRRQLKDDIALAKLAKDEGTKVAETRKKLQSQLVALESDLDILLSDKTKKRGDAQQIMERMSKEWKALYRWMADTHEQAANDLYVEAPHGRRRRLYGMLIDRNDIQAALCRRAVNAPVQGFGADVGHTAARILDIHLHKFQRKFKLMTGHETTVPGSVECAVHDALLMSVPYRLILPALQMKHWAMTIGVADYFYEFYGHKWLAVPEIETEIGWNEAEMDAWDFTPGGLRSSITKALEGQKAAGLFPKGTSVDDVLEEIFDIPKAWTDYLDTNYPWFGDTVYAAKSKKAA